MAEAVVPRVERLRTQGGLDAAAWSRVPAVALRRAQDGSEPLQATVVRTAYDDDALLVRFECDDRDIWATHRDRDAPLWEEEVVELFVAPGEGDPSDYLEIEVNPLGAIFDARVTNPHGTARLDAGRHGVERRRAGRCRFASLTRNMDRALGDPLERPLRRSPAARLAGQLLQDRAPARRSARVFLLVADACRPSGFSQAALFRSTRPRRP